MHTLGNLTLSAYNTELSNNPFQRKQQSYSSSALAMNRRIAETQRWGKVEILARADRLAERALAIWPGPIATEEVVGSDWALMRRALAVVPRGSWTSYGDIAEVVASSPIAVGGRCLRDAGMVSAWRVLSADGQVAAQFVVAAVRR